MVKEIFNYKEANILSPEKRIYHFYLYSRFLLNLKKINFNEKQNKDCNLYLIDQECINKIEEIKGLNKKIVIFFWNGQFDYEIYYKNNSNIENKNISHLIIGNSKEKSNLILDKIYQVNKTKIISSGNHSKPCNIGFNL